MSKSPDAFRSIGEVSRLVGVAPHVLRYWESQFSQLSPVKRADGRRYYRPATSGWRRPVSGPARGRS